MSMTIPPHYSGPDLISARARGVLARVKVCGTLEDAYKSADIFFAEVVGDESGASAEQKALVKTTRNAAEKFTIAQNKYNAAYITLEALIAGMPGPLSASIASVGCRVLDYGDKSADARQIGYCYGAGVNEASVTDQEKAATFVLHELSTSDKNFTDREMASLWKSVLTEFSYESFTPGKTLYESIAGVGHHLATDSNLDINLANKASTAILRNLKDRYSRGNDEDGVHKCTYSYLIDMVDIAPETKLGVKAEALKKLSEGDRDHSSVFLLKLGEKALQSAADDKQRRSLVALFSEGVQYRSCNDRQKLLAMVVRYSNRETLMPSSAARVGGEALKTLQRTTQGPLEPMVAHYCKTVFDQVHQGREPGNNQETIDAVRMAGVAMVSLEEVSTNRKVQELVKSALDAAEPYLTKTPHIPQRIHPSNNVSQSPLPPQDVEKILQKTADAIFDLTVDNDWFLSALKKTYSSDRPEPTGEGIRQEKPEGLSVSEEFVDLEGVSLHKRKKKFR